MDSALVIREARAAAGLTQTELARRAGMSQPVIARLERPGANPRAATLAKVLEAAGHRLTLERAEVPPLDVDQLDRHLAMPPAERLRAHQAAANSVAALVARRG